MRTVQQFEMDDDLGDLDVASPQYGGKAVPVIFRNAGAIWPAAGSTVNISVYSDTLLQIDVQVLAPENSIALAKSGQSTFDKALTISFAVKQEGRHIIQVKQSIVGSAPARTYVKVDYLGPSTSSLF
jgi:hypothetical protein